MPPVRSIPAIKAVKTERTHEENQERAYIAASRRSDRSLEARVESARRASEIHKRRTGRALRVTEQDVVNEEMYEEEDDSLSLQYRRLTAHLNTPSADFNRRLASYLTNHVAMRSALDQAINSSLSQDQAQQHWPANTQNMPSPTEQNPQYPTTSPLSPQSPSFQSFPAPSDPNYRSTLLSQILQNSIRNGATAALVSPGGSESNQTGTKSRENSDSPHPGMPERSTSSTSQMHADRNKQLLSPASETTSNARSDSLNWLNPVRSASPLSTTLPPETQMFFGAGIGGNDSFGNPTSGIFGNKNHNSDFVNPYVVGMSQTLAPDASGADKFGWPSYTAAEAPFSPSTISFPDHEDDHSPHNGDMHMQSHMDLKGQATPQEADWESFFDITSWEENQT